MDVLDILIDALRAAVLITGMVVIMMMMIESLNISSGGRFFQRLRGSKFGQIVVSALLGWIPGCLGGFASVSLFSHGMISFGALVAMLIATSGDEAFVMLTLFPWENRETEAKPPRQPGIQPSRAETTIWPNFEPRSRWKKRPPEEMFRLSIIIIMITTIPVMSTAARRASIRMSSTSIG